MAQTFNQTVNTKFNKGLLTEYSELTFPEDGSVDELNCDLHKAGNRTKRKAVEYEDDYVQTNEVYPSGILYQTLTWENVGNDADKEFLVVQVGSKLRFYHKGVYPFSGAIVPEEIDSTTPMVIDLDTFAYVGGLGAGASKVDVTSINGYLVVVSPQIESFYVAFEGGSGKIKTTRIDFKIRDFGYYSDPKTREEEISGSDVPGERLYDTLNGGWLKGPLKTWRDSQGTLPPLTHPWYSGKDSNGSFSVSEWKKVYSGSSLIANGHFIIDLFDPDREVALPDTTVTTWEYPDRSGVPGKDRGVLFPTKRETIVSGGTFEVFADWEGLPIPVPTSRFNTVETYAGRVWYSGVDSRVYYTKILENADYFGALHSQNDPTAEYSNDVLATDGGYIIIPEANGIKKLHVFGSSILVFANNGVWRISGSDGNMFQADDFSVYKITDAGLAFRGSFVSGQNSVPFWWSYLGIHTIAVTEEGGMVEENLSRDTIQTFWEKIGAQERGFVTGIYDAFDSKILWMYPNKDETVEHKLNNILFLDTDLGAFYPWKITDTGGLTTPYIVGLSFFNGKGSDARVFNVIDENDDQVQDSAGNDVIIKRETGTLSSSNVYFLTRMPNGRLTFSLFKGPAFLDWGTMNYEAYAESSYNFIGDLGRQKNSPYITVFMRQTETGFEDTGLGYEAINPSSLSVSAYWDFQKKPTARPQEAYRHKQPVMFEDVMNFPSPTTVLSTRLKLRGRGKSMRIRFEGKEGHDFNLLGWETLDARKGGY